MHVALCTPGRLGILLEAVCSGLSPSFVWKNEMVPTHFEGVLFKEQK